MTEAEWLTAADPEPMLKYWNGMANERKSRLFVSSCCRAVAGPLRVSSQEVLESAERYADGIVDEEELEVAWSRFNHLVRTNPPPFLDIFHLAVKDRLPPNEMVIRCVRDMETSTFIPPRAIARLVHDIFGNPFRPITLEPSWLTSTVVALAQQMYDSRVFSPMPILADALQESGCENDEILNHCRQPGVHVRGCFVVDLLLGKSGKLARIYDSAS